MLLEVAIRSPLRKLFTYESETSIPRGVRVRVPFRSKDVTGFVWRTTEKIPTGPKEIKLKKVAEVLDEQPIFDEVTLDYFERSAQYYTISLGELLSSALPKAVREGKPIRSPELKHFVPVLPELSSDQKSIFDSISETKNFATHLLLGETGSGKTEIYLHLMERLLEEGGQILFLVPEISLTPQLEDRLFERLGARVTVFHSQQTEKKREEAFARAHLGHTDVFLGARSALLLPFKNLKLIVVDEEHDASYKQFERGPYHARDLAILRAKLFRIPIVLGSATPSLESYSRALEGEMQIHRLSTFYKSQPSQLQIVDLKKTWESESKSFLTQQLHEKLENVLMRNDQGLIFLNRRGSASQRLCLKCGDADTCKHCSVTLTIHSDLHRAVCHWCGFQQSLDAGCVSCGSKEFFLGGIGTKEVEIQMKARFPEARIARLDRDEAQRKNYLAETLRDFAEGKIDFLIGTQMISKGIDIPRLSLVAVILADQGWGVPDFRALERSFQLLKQLKGRAGRRGQNSEFIIQTLNPHHPLFQWLEGDSSFEAFAQEELKLRKLVNFPPYCRLALVTFSHKVEQQVIVDSRQLLQKIQKFAESLKIEIMGPTPAPISKWKGVFRYHLMFKAPLKGHLTTFLTAVMDEVERQPLKSKIKVDRDPYQFM